MLHQMLTRIIKTGQMPVVPSFTISEDGVALVAQRDVDGTTKCRPSTGVADETFVGFASNGFYPPSFLPMVIETTAALDNAGKVTVELPRLPIPGQILVKIAGTPATMVAGAVAAPGEAALQGNVLTFNAGAAGADLFIQMQYEPSMQEARNYQGDGLFGRMTTSARIGVTGYIASGDLATNMFDASADWHDLDVMHPSLGADGLLTIGGPGTVLTNVLIKQAPTAGQALLVLEVK